MRFRINIVVIAVALAVAGCGKKNKDGPEKATVSGTVTFKNQPLEGAVVTFTVKGVGSGSSSTDAEGRYEIKNVPLGKAQVTVAKYETVTGSMNPEDMRKRFMTKKKKSKPKQIIPAKYGNPTTSGFTAEVKADESANSFNFDLR